MTSLRGRRAAAAAAAALWPVIATAQDAVRGAGLYLQLPGVASCVSCHGPDLLANRNGFLRAADNPQALQKALNAVGAMGYLKPVLTAPDVNDLAAFLGRVAPLASGDAALQVWPLTLEFGTLGLGSVSPAQTVQLRNRGVVALEVGPMQWSGEGFLLEHDCPELLPPGAQCAARVRYQAAAPGAAAGALAIPGAATARPVLAALGARTEPSARAVLQWDAATPTTLSFEPTLPGEQRSARLVLVNAGASDATLGATTVIGPQAGAFVPRGCAAGSVLAPASTCELHIDYRALGNGGAEAVLQLRSDGANPASLRLQAPATVPVTPPAASAPGGQGDRDDGSGGGAMAPLWAALLGLLAAALKRRAAAADTDQLRFSSRSTSFSRFI